jgi:hypothetical protein
MQHCIAHGGGKRCQKEGCLRQLKAAARNTVSRTEGPGAASTRAVPRGLEAAARPTSDELTVLYSNGPDDRSVKLALGYVTAATSGC